MSRTEMEAEENRIKKVLMEITEALRRQDLEAYLTGFHEEVVVARQGIKLLEGIEQWRKSMEKDIQTPISVTYDKIYLKLSESREYGYCVADFKFV